MVMLFIKNSHPDMAHNFQLHCITTFAALVEKGLILERALVAKGQVKKIYDKEKSFGDKPHYWNRNKNIVNDGVTNTKHVQVATTTQKYPPQQQPSVQNTIFIPQGAPRQESNQKNQGGISDSSLR